MRFQVNIPGLINLMEGGLMAMDIKIPVAMEMQRVSAPVSAVGVKASVGAASQQSEEVAEQQQQPVQGARNSEFSPEEVEAAVRNLNDYVQNVQRNLQFNIDDDSGHTVIKVIDSDTEELIRQIPSEEVLAVARHLREMEEQQGVIFQQKA
jgi:flagellar protein FlaG